jgi:hypothetical protein
MLGVGPQWAHLKQSRKTTDSFSGKVTGDFMFWPAGRHRFGWYLETAMVTASSAVTNGLLACRLAYSSASGK